MSQDVKEACMGDGETILTVVFPGAALSCVTAEWVRTDFAAIESVYAFRLALHSARPSAWDSL